MTRLVKPKGRARPESPTVAVEDIKPLNRAQRRQAKRAAEKAARGPQRDGIGIILNVVQVPSKGTFRIQEKGTMNIMRNRSGQVVEFPTAEAAHAALIRLKEMTEKNLEKSRQEVEVYKARISQQVAEAHAEGKLTGLEGTDYDPDTCNMEAESPGMDELAFMEEPT